MIFFKHQKILFSILFLCQFIHTDDLYYKFGDIANTYNSFGITGLIQTPSAEQKGEGSLFVTFTDNDIYKYGSLTISPYDWLEANYFYYRPNDLWWVGPATAGQYLDKGFSVKFSKRIANGLSLALGLDDFAGTGYFSKEYLVATVNKEYFRLSLGLGTGYFVSGKGFTNPLTVFGDQFRNRPAFSEEFAAGGSLAYDQWFRGPVDLFGGIEIFHPFFKNFIFKIENDPFNYITGLSGRLAPGIDKNLRQKESDLNFGISYKFIENSNITLSFIKGNTVNLTLSFGGIFNKPLVPKENTSLKPSINHNAKINNQAQAKNHFYEDLLSNLNQREVYLQSAHLNEKDIEITISSSKYREPLLAAAIAGEITNEILKAYDYEKLLIDVTSLNVGHELNKYRFTLDSMEGRRNQIPEIIQVKSSALPGRDSNLKNHEFTPKVNFPSSFIGLTPALVNHIGDPAKFYYGGLILRLKNEIQFSRRLQLNTNISQNLYNNFDAKVDKPDSRLPNVRTDIVKYLQQSDTYLERMQLDFFFKLTDSVYGKTSLGILEDMYSGYGIEFLYKPFYSQTSLSLELFDVQKRAFDRKFGLEEYKITTGHISLNRYFSSFDMLAQLSFGRYLAGDDGYTLDLSRRLDSGFVAGIFFSRTNVSAQRFGEGSFDKGFYFSIPIDLFLQRYRPGGINFQLRPLTRDGGQKLNQGSKIIDVMHHTAEYELNRNWSLFND